MSRELHLMGIGGAGMSGIARVLRGYGRTVSGCDRSPAAVEELRGEGFDAHVGHDPAHLRPGMELIISTAVDEGEPELAAARRQGLRVRHRSDVLADIVASGEGICVAGAHGKTSTTALIAYVLQECGEDPTFLVGGVVPQLGSNARLGEGRYVVAEADESDGSLARLRPRAAVVLNAELDHHDHFASLDDLHALFRAWVQELPREGLLVLHESLDYPAESEVRRYGAGPGEGWRALDVVADGDGTRFVLSAPGREPLPLRLGVPGAHNALNATAALALLDWAGIQPARAATPLAEFRGAARRYERRGEVAGIRLVDDYAHHPSELAATLTAARGEAPPGRLLACFQPHMPWRTSKFADGFAAALRLADAACVCDVYVARGASDPAVTGELVVESAHRQDPAFPIAWTPGYVDAAEWIVRTARPGDLVLTLGAGPVDAVLGLVRERLG
ncbi:MAG: UDP-N-acetylmuramate--alanine ligase [Gaiellales bacterium]|jgi:UDP-N-acetylmuramate--alanine ligase|nr:UDP-N-acetylmuramate--alanine ligase [Gaiellales bacterium]